MGDKETISTIVNLYMADKVGSLSAEDYTKLYLETESKVSKTYVDCVTGKC